MEMPHEDEDDVELEGVTMPNLTSLRVSNTRQTGIDGQMKILRALKMPRLENISAHVAYTKDAWDMYENAGVTRLLALHERVLPQAPVKSFELEDPIIDD
jgi:hypothetical protein